MRNFLLAFAAIIGGTWLLGTFPVIERTIGPIFDSPYFFIFMMSFIAFAAYVDSVKGRRRPK